MKVMETNTAAIYLRKSTEDDGTSASSATNHHRSLCQTELAQSSPFGH